MRPFRLSGICSSCLTVWMSSYKEVVCLCKNLPQIPISLSNRFIFHIQNSFFFFFVYATIITIILDLIILTFAVPVFSPFWLWHKTAHSHVKTFKLLLWKWKGSLELHGYLSCFLFPSWRLSPIWPVISE